MLLWLMHAIAPHFVTTENSFLIRQIELFKRLEGFPECNQ